MRKNKLLLLLALLMTAATGAWAQDAKHLITATYREQTRSLEQPLPYATTIGELFEAVTGEHFSDLISTMSSFEMPLTGISSNNTSAVSIGELNGASTPVTVIADGKATISINFGSYAHGIFISAISPLYANMKSGVKDAGKWTVKVGEGQAQALPIGGLKGDGSETVTLQYTGRLKVKGVKATSEAAPAEASVPDGAINGKFSVSDGKQVYFSKGNLRYDANATTKWYFAANQYDYIGTATSYPMDLFTWGNIDNPAYDGDGCLSGNSNLSGATDWGSNIGTGWYTLSSDEWTYLFNTRSASTVGDTENARYTLATINTDGTSVNGVILFPDGATFAASEATTWGTINGVSEWTTKCTTAQWTALEAKGCVFLPAAGYRSGSSMGGLGTDGVYWSSTADGTGYALQLYYKSNYLSPAETDSRTAGFNVRLVREVATSDATPAKEPATVTTAPTGAAIVGVGKNTALVSGGVADGGTMMYQMTTTNTKPTSTDGFSDAVPTAQTITASGKVYVWYYVKGDDTHSDSEIAATAIEVPVADIVWDRTNVSSDISVEDPSQSYEKEGVTLSANAENIFAGWNDTGDPKTDGISFQVYGLGGFTFTAPTGKEFTKIEMNAVSYYGWNEANLGSGWEYFEDDTKNIYTVTWTGSAASTDKLLPLTDDFVGENVISIAFYLSE